MKKNITTFPSCALVLIGNELLSGRTPDQNMNHLARRMADIGINLLEARVIPDIEREIVNTVNELRKKYTYVFTTGGIGPTHDDITMAAIAKAFQVPIVRDEKTAKAFHNHYGEKVNEAMLTMADFPKGARLINNPISIAPGFSMGNVYAFAGIPRVMQTMLEAVIPLLEKGEKIISQNIDAHTSESKISKPFAKIQHDYPTLELGSYPFRVAGKACTSLVVRGADKNAVAEAVNKIEAMLNKLGVTISS